MKSQQASGAMNLLVVDDHALNRDVLRMQLEAEGHRVLEATNGIEALEILDRESVDGVVSDILMPGMDGFQLCLEIRKRKNLARLPFIFYTGTFKSPKDRELARTIGVDQYLTKPSTPREIIGALEQAMQRTRDRIAVSAARHDETYVLKQYNEALVRKLEERNLELEEALKNLRIAHDGKQESEQRFRAIFDHAGIGITTRSVHDRTLPWAQVNDHFCKLLGYTREELLKLSTADITPADGQERAVKDNERLLSGDIASYSREKQLVRKDGRRIWVVLTVTSLPGPDGRPATLIATYQDITEDKLQQQKIERLSRIRALSSGINTAIVRARNPQALFAEACRIAVEQGRLGSAWIGSLDPATLEITPVAWAGEGSEEMRTTRSTARDDPPRGQGAVSRAVRERRAVFNNDLSLQSFGGPRRDAVLKLGFHSMVALPLLAGDKVVGTFTLYAREPGFFDADEVALLTELAGNVSFALEHMARQEKIDKLSRIRAISSGINAAIVRTRDRKALLEETCRIVSEQGKFEMVWIGTIDHEKQELQPVAWTGFSEETARAVNWASISTSKGTLGEAIQTRKPSVRNDIKAELPGGRLRHEALQKGCRSTVCLPLVVDDKVVALIVLFAPGTGFFDEEELVLLDEVASDISFALQAIEKQKKLDYLSYYDVLTGLANRSLFLDRVAQYMRSAASGGHKLAVGLIDLERFKNINDSLGQPAGDALLKQVAEWLTHNLGDANLVARLGADHFAVVLPEIRQEGDVARLVEKLMAAFLEHPFRLNDAVFRIAAKVGVALYPDDGTDAGTLFRNGEAALKKAKASGERYLFYAQKMTDTVAGRLTLENQLRQALDNGEFVLHYQPKVNLASGKMTSAEALIRWNNPRTGLVPPGRFIPSLEETGLIQEVGRWALRKAVEDYLRWRAAGLAAVRIAVNVSALQLRNRGFIAEIQQAIGIDAHAAAGLELEITESLIMADVKNSIASLQAIRALGVTIAIDDFGTGFSSLSYLSKLPVDTLKIDRSFVIDMTAGQEGLALVSTIINLGHSLQLKVVAEGVETEEQSNLLRLLKCDEMQGFLFSKPLPAAEFEPMLRAQATGASAQQHAPIKVT